MTIPIRHFEPQPAALDSILAEVRSALERLDYGHIALTIHAGKVVQIDVTEKKRFV